MIDYKKQIDLKRLPSHVAIIMDGNGRWAQKQGKGRLEGHHQGVVSVREVTEMATDLGLKYLTLYTFSTENWNRPKEEVDGLMALLVENIIKETPRFHKNNIKFRVIGDLSRLPKEAFLKLQDCIADTSKNTGLTLILALSYSGRWEIVEAHKQIAREIQAGQLTVDDINEACVSRHMATKDFPDPELLIRTSGEVRISNFLLWQIAYSELYFTPVLWPDFKGQEFCKALVEYQGRERRFGKTSEQL